MTQAVKNILARMQAELPPSIHLRGNAEAQEQFLADYVQVLSGWSREVLEAAWPVVLSRQEFWIWPRPQQIHDARKQIADQRQQPISLEERRQEAQDQRFRTGTSRAVFIQQCSRKLLTLDL